MSGQRKIFAVNDQVLVLAEGGWKQAACGKISSAAEPVETLQGHDFFYWVTFDQPQEDVNGPDKYLKAQILSCYIEPAI
ncbi:hypothetical protein [Stutzerimonas stutzeri]|uniref:hypothetical protein n=1 Tax=Stutzerimonas stutzeri TaxID=316 RepID=UPI00371D0062